MFLATIHQGEYSDKFSDVIGVFSTLTLAQQALDNYLSLGSKSYAWLDQDYHSSTTLMGLTIWNRGYERYWESGNATITEISLDQELVHI